MQTKGSLQLSINAIVVLVLAITILGLGLKFITDQFQSAQGSFEVANDEIKNQLFDELDNGELLSVRVSEFSLESGKPTDFYFGIRNTDTDDMKRFFVQFLCEGSTHDSTDCGDVFNDHNQWEWFDTFSSIDIPPGQSKAVYSEVQAQSPKNEYRGKIIVWVCNDTSTQCPNRREVCYNNTDIAEPYDWDGSACDPSTPAGAKRYAMEKINVNIQ
mgnify:CR=1 FL=1